MINAIASRGLSFFVNRGFGLRLAPMVITLQSCRNVLHVRWFSSHILAGLTYVRVQGLSVLRPRLRARHVLQYSVHVPGVERMTSFAPMGVNSLCPMLAY